MNFNREKQKYGKCIEFNGKEYGEKNWTSIYR